MGWSWGIYPIKKRIKGYDRLPKVYMEITNEPSNLRIKTVRHYVWNSETTTGFRISIKKSLIESNIAVDSKLVDEIMDIGAKRSDSLLVYE